MAQRPMIGLRTQGSSINPFSDSRVLTNFTVWSHLAPSVSADPESVFGKLLVLPGSTAKRFKVRQIYPSGFEKEVFELDASDCFNTNDDMPDTAQILDVGQLAHQNAAAVLSFLEEHWRRGNIYTTVDPLLVAINPFRDLGLSTAEVVRRYKTAESVDSLPPHVFSVARRAFETYTVLQQSQVIIVTGESGAGKTEATKMVMQFLAVTKTAGSNVVQQRIMAANPVLEAFGNAKTIRNDNSSRFGRFMQLEVAAAGIQAGAVQGFLLEKVRVVSQETDERSYHIFYQLLKGASSRLRTELGLQQPSYYGYLKGGNTYDVAGIDDARDWEDVTQSLTAIGFSETTQLSIFRVLAAVLNLGNLQLVATSSDGSAVHGNCVGLLKCICELIGLNNDVVLKELTSSVVKVGSEVVQKQLKFSDAQVQKDSLAKALYERLFQWIIAQLNKTVAPHHEEHLSTFIAMLDIFGFEILSRNSLEQLMINIANEYVQKCFIDIVFAREQRLYKEEGIRSDALVYTSNEPIIQTLIGHTSVLGLLEDACVAPGGSDETFVASCIRALAGGSSSAFKPTKRNAARHFIIAHSVADVEYDAVGFLHKNKDLLKPELIEANKASNNSVVRGMFESLVVEKGKLAKGQLIASQFKQQLTSLIDVISSTESHFIRCIKPNEVKSSTIWNAGKVLNQLFCLSILEALQLKQLGFSYRRPFSDFCKQFRYLDISAVDDFNQPRETVAEQILLKNGMRPLEDFQIGKTRIFMTLEAARRLMLAQRKALAVWSRSLLLLEAALLRYKWRCELAREEWRLRRLQLHGLQLINQSPPDAGPKEFQLQRQRYQAIMDADPNSDVAKAAAKLEARLCEKHWLECAYYPVGKPA